MKHNFLRRLCALVMALVMAASLCVSPAWADDGDGSDSGPIPEFDKRLIILKDAAVGNRQTLTLEGLAVDDIVTWTTTGNITVNDAPTGPITADNLTCTITVGASTSPAQGEINVRVTRSSKTLTALPCYVYCGTVPFLDIPPQEQLNSAGLAVNGTLPIEIRVLNHADIINDKITFDSSNERVATVDKEVSPKNGVYRATVTGLSTGPVIITMHIQGYSFEWNLTVSAASTSVPVTTVQFNNVPNTIRMTVGETYTFPEPSIAPSNATNKNLIWDSDNKGVVTVDENTRTITAVGVGSTSVTVSAENGKGLYSSVTFGVVVSDAPFSLEVAPADNYSATIDLRTGISKGNTTRIEVKISGLNSDKATVTRWTSSNQNVAALENPNATTKTVTVVGKANGTTKITAYVTYTDANGRSVSTSKDCTVTVLDDKSVEITSIGLSETTHTMPADGTFKLTATVAPSNALNKSIEWDSSDKSVATVDENGNVTACGVGETLIIAKAAYGNLSNSCKVTVTPITETIRLTSMPDLVNTSLGSGRYSYTFRNGTNDTANFTAVLTPTGAADPVHWASKDTSIVKVEASASKSTQAKITAVSPGKTTVTAIPMDPAGKDRVLASGPVQLEITVSGLAIENTDNHALTSLSLMEDQRQELVAAIYGAANTDSTVDWTSYDPSIVTVNPKSGASTTIIARAPGTTTVTARKGSYLATCTVTVLEDTVGVIEASTQPGVAYQFSSLASRLQTACTTKTGSSLAYITNLSVSSTDQGVLYDQHHSSADTGAGVGMQDKYYPGTAPQGQRSLSDLSFVPKNTFSGTAEISYTAWSTDNKSFSGLIRISVNGTGDVMYASSEGSVVTFLADDFNLYHPNLRSVSFSLPLDSRGTLYYGYSSASQPGTKVTSGTAYYRTGTPSLDRVSFVPTAGYEGTVSITYTATDTSGRNTTGTVTINVTNNKGTSGTPADLYYPVAEDSWVTFQPADFNTASMSVLGEPLSYVRFSLPASSDGTLFYNYRGFGNYDSAVASTTSYYYGGTPSLGSVSFVPTTTTPGQVEIKYTGYTVRGNTFTGTIHIGESDPNEQRGLRYTVFTGKSVYFNATDFNNACISATGASLSYVLFSPLPAVGEGTLRYTRGTSSTVYNLATTTRCYRTSSSTTNVLLGSVSFLANNSFTGTVTIPFTGYNTNNVSFTGEVVITVTPPTSGDSVYYGTTASPLALSSSRVRSACSDVLDGTLSYITFTSLPSSSTGRLYLNYNGFGTGTQVNTGTQYYVSGTPNIDQISFVPRGRYTGQVSVGYTATNTNGKSVSGLITFNITSTGNSAYFNDMAYHTWAGPAVDYLYRNGVTKGVTATTYGPEEHILRCDFVLMLCRAFNFTGGSGYSFADVPTDAYFADAVATAKQLGIVNGDGVNFMPYSELTRQDAMVIFKNALDAAGWNVSNASTSVLSTFPDGVSVASYARTAVSTLVQLGAVSGDNGMLYPYNPITRAEAAVILHFVMTM